MTDNELIAEWLGLEIVEAVDEGLKGLRAEDGKLFYGKGGLRYAIPDGGGCKPWNPSIDITIWHDGLLKKIEENHPVTLKMRFSRKLYDANMPQSSEGCVEALWMGMNFTSAQLTAALVAVIKEE